MTKLHNVSLETLAGGAVPERFDRELERVLKNIADPNTDAQAVREISVKVRIKPAADRESAVVRLDVASKVAPAKPVATPIHFGTDRTTGKLVAIGYDPRQPELPFEGHQRQDPDVKPGITHAAGADADAE